VFSLAAQELRSAVGFPSHDFLPGARPMRWRSAFTLIWAPFVLPYREQKNLIDGYDRETDWWVEPNRSLVALRVERRAYANAKCSRSAHFCALLGVAVVDQGKTRSEAEKGKASTFLSPHILYMRTCAIQEL
jgi:hypothetical protein